VWAGGGGGAVFRIRRFGRSCAAVYNSEAHNVDQLRQLLALAIARLISLCSE